MLMINHSIFHKFFRRKKYDIFHKKYNIDWVNFCDSLLPGAWATPPPRQLDWTRQPLTICQLKYFSTVLFTLCCSRRFIIIQSWSASTWVTHRVDGVRWTTACQSTRHMLTPAVARPHCSRRQESHTRPLLSSIVLISPPATTAQRASKQKPQNQAKTVFWGFRNIYWLILFICRIHFICITRWHPEMKILWDESRMQQRAIAMIS